MFGSFRCVNMFEDKACRCDFSIFRLILSVVSVCFKKAHHPLLTCMTVNSVNSTESQKFPCHIEKFRLKSLHVSNQ